MRLRTANKRLPHKIKIKSWKYNSTRTPRKRKKETQRWIKYWDQYRKPGAVYHSCSLHPCYVTNLNVEIYNGRYYGGDISGKSLLDGSEGHGCDLRHCGVYLMGAEEILGYKEAWERDRERGILTYYSGSEEYADEFIKNWR